MGEHGPLTEELAARAALRRPEACAALVARVRGALATWVAVRLGPALRARVTEDDVLQETFLQAYRSLDTFANTGPGSFRRWLMTVAEHRIKDLHRFHAAKKRDVQRERVTPANAEESVLWDRLSVAGPSPVSVADLQDNRRLIASRIEALPAELRDVLVARALEERPFKDIAERLDRPITTVQAQFARALRTLKAHFDGPPSL